MLGRSRFALAWMLPLAVAVAAAWSPWAAWGTVLVIHVVLMAAEVVPALRDSPAAAASTGWHRCCVLVHVPLQLGLLGWALWLLTREPVAPGAALALAIAVGTVTGAQGISFAHELGHSRSRAERSLGWLLMVSVNYAHFMVEHYRGHHVQVATAADPASARRGESLWRFLPRTLIGSWRSAWRLEARQLRQLGRGWSRSPLLWATLMQVFVMLSIGFALGTTALLFWVAQSAYAVLLLETINYIEHYGLQRRVRQGRPEPFGVEHAWNADHLITNSLLINLQRHSDHHLHAWKPYASLEPLPGPQLPMGYAGCVTIAMWPPLWFRLMHRRLDALPAS